MASTHISGPAIARLLAFSRMTANEPMRAGRFGPVLRRCRIRYAVLDAIQRSVGTTRRFLTDPNLTLSRHRTKAATFH